MIALTGNKYLLVNTILLGYEQPIRPEMNFELSQDTYYAGLGPRDWYESIRVMFGDPVITVLCISA